MFSKSVVKATINLELVIDRWVYFTVSFLVISTCRNFHFLTSKTNLYYILRKSKIVKMTNKPKVKRKWIHSQHFYKVLLFIMMTRKH